MEPTSRRRRTFPLWMLFLVTAIAAFWLWQFRWQSNWLGATIVTCFLVRAVHVQIGAWKHKPVAVGGIPETDCSIGQCKSEVFKSNAAPNRRWSQIENDLFEHDPGATVGRVAFRSLVGGILGTCVYGLLYSQTKGPFEPYRLAFFVGFGLLGGVLEGFLKSPPDSSTGERT